MYILLLWLMGPLRMQGPSPKTPSRLWGIALFSVLAACHAAPPSSDESLPVAWHPPDTSEWATMPEGDLVRYGRDLIVHTARYFGPQGSLSRKANGLNCQNCHIAAGTRAFGYNFSKVASTYPQLQKRSGRYVSIAARINGCMERSMNGAALDTNSREVAAMIAYFKWLGKDVRSPNNLFGTGTEKLPLLSRPADSARGQQVFAAICQACHGKDGQGQWNADSTEYLYPPLWGPQSYNIGAGIYQVSRLAGFVKNNMPFGTTYHAPVLTVEQAWDVAAFVNAQPHPPKDLHQDWPRLEDKPADYPFGPYADTFSERRHKYGPFQELVKTNP